MSERNLTKLAHDLLPLIRRDLGIAQSSSISGIIGASGDHSHPDYLTLTTADGRYALLSNYNTHVGNPNAHHNRQHDIVESLDHTTTAAAGFVLGTSAPSTLTMLATTADGAANHGTILKSDASGGLTLDKVRTPLIDTASGDLTLSPADELLLTADKTFRSTNFVAPDPFITGFSIHQYPENPNKHRFQVGRIEADELVVKLFTADETLVRRGSDWLTPAFGIVARDEYGEINSYTMPPDTSTVHIWFHDSVHTAGAIFLEDEWVMLQFFERDAGLTVLEIWGQVSGYYTDANRPEMQRWTFTNRTSGVSGYVVRPGMMFIGFGEEDQGWIYRTVLGGGPREKFVTWSGSNPRDGDRTTQVQIGDLTDAASEAILPVSGYGFWTKNGFLEGNLYAAAGEVAITTDGTNIKADSVQASSWTDYGNKISWIVDPLDPTEAEVVAQAWATRYDDAADTIGDWWLVTKAGGTSALTDATINLQAEDSPYTALVSVQVTNSAPYIVLSAGDSGSTQDATIIVGGRASTITVSGGPTGANFSPATDLGAQLGEPSFRWSEIHVDKIYADAEIVAGTLSGSTWAHSGDMFVNVNNAAGTGTLYVRNNVPGLTADIDVEGDAFVHGDVVVDGNVDGVNIGDLKSDYDGHIVDGAHTELDIDNNAVVGGTLGVTGVATLANNATVGGTLGVTGVATLSDDVTVGGTLDVTGTLTAEGALSVGGSVGVDGTITGLDTISGTSLIASTSVISPILRPASDSTTAIKLANASGTAVVTVDTLTPSVGVTGTLGVTGNISTTGLYSVTSTSPEIQFNESDTSQQWRIVGAIGNLYVDPETTNGSFYIRSTGNTPRLTVNTGTGLVSMSSNISVGGNATISGDVIASVIKPASDATDALVLADSSGSAVLTVDTINDAVDVTGDLDAAGSMTVEGQIRSNTQLRAYSSLTTSNVIFTGYTVTFDRASANYIDASNAAGSLRFRVASSEKMRVSSAGVNTYAATSVGGTLGVTGVATFNNDIVASVIKPSIDATNALQLAQADGTPVLNVDTIAPQVDVTGALVASGAISSLSSVDAPIIDIISGETTYGRMDSTGIYSLTPQFTDGLTRQGFEITWAGDFKGVEADFVTLKSYTFELLQLGAVGGTLVVKVAGRLHNEVQVSDGSSVMLRIKQPEGKIVRHLAVGDRIRIKALGDNQPETTTTGIGYLSPALWMLPRGAKRGKLSLGDSWFIVASVDDENEDYTEYTVDLAYGTAQINYPRETTVVKYGRDGDGMISLSSEDFSNSPFIDIDVLSDTPWVPSTNKKIIKQGNLEGLGIGQTGEVGIAISTDLAITTNPRIIASNQRLELHKVGITSNDGTYDTAYLGADGTFKLGTNIDTAAGTIFEFLPGAATPTFSVSGNAEFNLDGHMLLLGGSAVYARGDAYEDWFNDDFGSTLGWVTRLDDEGVAVVAGHSVFAMRTHLTQAGVFTVDPPRSMMEIRGSYGDYISDYDLHDITYGTVTNGHGLTEFVLYSDDEPYPDGFPELEHGHIVGVLGITVRNRYGENEQRIFSAYGRPEASAIVLNPTEVTINTDRFDILAEASFRGGVRFLLDQDLDSGRRERFRITGLPREGDTDLVANELYIASDGKLAIYEE